MSVDTFGPFSLLSFTNVVAFLVLLNEFSFDLHEPTQGYKVHYLIGITAFNNTQTMWTERFDVHIIHYILFIYM